MKPEPTALLVKPSISPRVRLSPHVWGLWAALAAVTLSATKADPDLWGHVRFGLDWWRERSLPSVDPYSFTQDRPWINHEWLSEAFMGAAYAMGGPPGLVLLKMAIVGLALFTLWRRVAGASIVITVVTLALAIGCVLPISLTVRPQLWSVTGLVLLVALMDSETAPDGRRMAAGAMLFAGWANFHGGWITGAAVLWVYVLVRVLRTREQVLRWVAFVACCLAGTLLNPYGLGLWRFLGGTVRPQRLDISEWQPLTLGGPISFWAPLALTAVLTTALSIRRETRPRPEVWAVLILLVAGAVRVMRVAPLMGPAALALLMPCLRHVRGGGEPTVATRQAALVFYAPVLVAAFAAITISVRAMACLPIRDAWAPDREAAARLRGLSGRLLTTFDWGEYAIWHFGPALRVSIDGRRETVYSDDVVQRHLAFEDGAPEGQSMAAALAPDYVWLRSRSRPARQWLVANGYLIEFESERSFIAVRHDHPPLPTRADALPPCFP